MSLERLHPIKSFGNVHADRGDIRIETLESRIIPRVPFPHKHDFYQIVFILRGKGKHEVDFSIFPVQNRQVFILKPGQVHSWNLHPQSKGFLIEFTMESLTTSDLIHSSNFIQRIQALPDQLLLKEDLFKKWKPLFASLSNEQSHKKTDAELYLQSHLSIFLIDLFRADQKKRNLKPHSEIGVQFINLVENHFKNEHSLDFYAEALKTPPKILGDRVRKNLGLSPKEIIQNRCLLEAQRMLRYTDLSVAEIGYALGFEDANYFSRFFRQYSKQSAQKFRDQRKG